MLGKLSFWGNVVPFQSYGFTASRWHNLAVLAHEGERPVLASGVQSANHVPHLANAAFPAALSKAHQHFPDKSLIVVRNSKVLITERFLSAVERLIADVDADWSLLTGSGLGLNNERYNAHYSAAEPQLRYTPERRVALDSSPDVFVVSAQALSAWLDLASQADTLFEPAFIQYNLLAKRLAFYDPSLGCPINDRYLGRDYGHVRDELAYISTHLPMNQIVTLNGEFSLQKTTADSRKRPGGVQSESIQIRDAVREAMRPVLEPMKLSIVIRTIFKRAYLLHRLLASIVRALSPAVTLEVVLSSDIEPEKAREAFEATRKRFSTLNLKLALHDRNQHPEMKSRVRNLVLGVEKATSEYVWLLDDDDYVDPLAFEHLGEQLYYGVRPIFFVASKIQEEVWDENDDGHAVLTQSRDVGAWPADAWRVLFEGVNKVPVCGVVAPRERLLQALRSVPLRHDLSEDYAMHLALLLDRDLPPIVEIHQTLSHISMRGAEDSTMNMQDRMKWCADIFGFLHDLRYGEANLDRSILRLLVSVRQSNETPSSEITDLRATIAQLQDQNTTYRRQISFLLKELQTPA